MQAALLSAYSKPLHRGQNPGCGSGSGLYIQIQNTFKIKLFLRFFYQIYKYDKVILFIQIRFKVLFRWLDPDLVFHVSLHLVNSILIRNPG